MQPDPDADIRTLRPVDGRQVARPRRGGPEPAGGLGKCDEERIALGAALDAAVLDEGLAQRRAMAAQHVGIPIAERIEQAGRALDVREQERHGPDRRRA